MIQNTIQKIEAIISNAHRLPEHKRTALLTLIQTLNTELSELNHSEKKTANTLANLTEISAQKSLHETEDPNEKTLSIKGLRLAIQEIESSNPKLVKTLNEICTLLSNMGI